MRKLVLLGFLLLTVSACTGTPVQTVPQFPSVQVSAAQKRAYETGYQVGYQVGYDEGYRARAEEIKESYRLWQTDILSLRAGKYLIEKGIISRPSVFTQKDGTRKVDFDVEGAEFKLNRSSELFSLVVPYLPSPFIPVSVPSYSKFLSSPKVKMYLVSFPTPVEKIAFESGFEAGYEAGVKRGKSDAYEDAREVLIREKGILMKAELSKYASRNSFLTYPRVYRVRKGDSYSYLVVKPQVEMPRTIDDILNLKKVPLPQEVLKERKESSITLPSTFQADVIPSSSVPPVVKVKVRPEGVRILEQLSIPYEVSDDGYRAVFHSGKEAKAFCRKYRVCRRN